MHAQKDRIWQAVFVLLVAPSGWDRILALLVGVAIGGVQAACRTAAAARERREEAERKRRADEARRQREEEERVRREEEERVRREAAECVRREEQERLRREEEERVRREEEERVRRKVEERRRREEQERQRREEEERVRREVEERRRQAEEQDIRNAAEQVDQWAERAGYDPTRCPNALNGARGYGVLLRTLLRSCINGVPMAELSLERRVVSALSLDPDRTLKVSDLRKAVAQVCIARVCALVQRDLTHACVVLRWLSYSCV